MVFPWYKWHKSSNTHRGQVAVPALSSTQLLAGCPEESWRGCHGNTPSMGFEDHYGKTHRKTLGKWWLNGIPMVNFIGKSREAMDH